MRKMKKKILATLCATVGLGAIGTGITLASVFSSGEGITPVPTQETGKITTYYVDGGSQSSATYGAIADVEPIAQVNGVVANLYPKDKLVMRGVIDLREKDANDLLISTIAVPTIIGTAEVGEYYYDIVDVYDPTNYITARIRPYPHNDVADRWKTSYMTAYASNGQQPAGLDRGGSRIHINNPYGSWLNFAFHGAPEPVYDLKQSSFGISFDMETNVLYLHDGKTKEVVPVADFDSIDYFGTNTWKGFTTGEVYVRVYAGEYALESARLLVTEYNGFDLSSPAIDDTQGPTLSVDYGDYSADDYPVGVAGYKYPLFKPTAFDTYTGNAEVTTEVYLDYYTSNPVKQLFNKRTLEFTPITSGIYTVVYTAKDRFGNTSVKTIDIDVKKASEVAPLELELLECPETVRIGAMVAVPETEIHGAIGNTKLQITATLNDTEIAMKNGVVFVEKTGALKLTYTLSDYAGRMVEKQAVITVAATDKPTFIETPTLPKYFVEGNAYALPALSAYNYTDGSGAAIPTVVKARKAGETTANVISGAYVPAVDNHKDQVEIIYEATVNGNAATWSKFVPVYKTRTGDQVDMSKYFESENGTVTAQKKWLELEATSDASFAFVNSLYSTDLSMEMRMLNNSSNIEKLHIRLTDYYDANNEILFTYVNEKKKTQCYLNGDESVKLPVSFLFTTDALFTFTYQNDTKKIFYDIANSNYWNVDKNLAGEEFTGFIGNEFYLTIEFENVTGTGALALQKFYRHSFSSNVRDYIGPMVSIVGEYGGEVRIGETFVLPKALVCDMLDGKVTGTFTVFDPEGNVVTSEEGLALEDVVVDERTTTIRLTKFGAYEVRYFAVDRYNNKTSFSYIIRVIDDGLPTLEVLTNIPTTAKVGDKVYLPKWNVSDDKTAADKLVTGIYVVCPNGKIETLDREKNVGFVASEVGEYQVLYFVYDEEGNQTVKAYTVTVTGV